MRFLPHEPALASSNLIHAAGKWWEETGEPSECIINSPGGAIIIQMPLCVMRSLERCAARENRGGGGADICTPSRKSKSKTR